MIWTPLETLKGGGMGAYLADVVRWITDADCVNCRLII